MYCQECGKKIDDNVEFCTYCGKPTASAGVSNNVISNESKDKKEKSLNVAKIAGIVVIAILIVIVIILAAGKIKNKATDTAERTTDEVTDTAESTAKVSVLNDIIGDWDYDLRTGSNTYASSYESVSYLRVEAEGIKAISAESIKTLFYAVGVDDITIQEENGIKYYTYSAEMYSSRVKRESGIGRHKIGIRLYLDEVSGWLVCEFNVPDDGFWQRIGAYTPMPFSIEDHFAGTKKESVEDLKGKLKGRRFSTLEEALADDDFRNWFDRMIDINAFPLTWIFEYSAEGNNLILDGKYREEGSADSVFVSFITEAKVNGWMREWRTLVDEQHGKNPFTITIRCSSSDGEESAERTYTH